MSGPSCGNNPNYRMSDGDRQAVDSFSAYLTARAELNVAAHRLERIRDAARLHRQQLISANELYSVIEADSDAVLAVLPVPADRAAVLREAADRLAELRAAEREWLPATGLHKGEQELRRMTDEAQPTETPFVPPAHYRGRDGTEYCVHAIPVGPNSCPACRELADDEAPMRAYLSAPAVAEDAQRTTRRDSLRVLLGRAAAGLTPDEDAMMRQHVEAEQREVDIALAVIADHRVEGRALREKLAEAQSYAKLGAKCFRDHHPAQIAEQRATAAGWKEQADRLTAELAEAQAAIERVRAAAQWARRNYPGISHVHDRLTTALDGTEQPTDDTR